MFTKFSQCVIMLNKLFYTLKLSNLLSLAQCNISSNKIILEIILRVLDEPNGQKFLQLLQIRNLTNSIKCKYTTN